LLERRPDGTGLGEPAPPAAPDHLLDRGDILVVSVRPVGVGGGADRVTAGDRELCHRASSRARCLDPPRGARLASRRFVRKVSCLIGARVREETVTAAQQTYATGTPSLLRAINERTVLDRIRDGGPVSRAQIARETGLSKPTVSQALMTLERSRL